MNRIWKNYKTILGVGLLSFFLWFIVKTSKTYEYQMDIPIRYTNLDSERIFKHPQSSNARVEFVGKGKDLLRLHFYDVGYQIDLSGVPDNMRLDLSEHPEFVSLPGELDLAVKSIMRPRFLNIQLDNKVERKLPVEVRYQVKVPPGFLLSGVEPQPDSVLVIGPEVVFDSVRSVQTESKSFSPHEQAFQEKFELKKPKNFFVRYKPENITVNFDVQRLAEREIFGVPVEVINPPEDAQVIALPSVANIYIKGGEKVLADLKARDFRIIVDFEKVWRPGVERVKADLKTKTNVLYM
ncbi:MAG: CdaR family protein, partial [Calditrichia bacterium]